LFLEELVGQDASLWKALYGKAHFYINVSVEDFVLQGILFDNRWGKQGIRYLHIFESVKWGREVKLFYAEAIYLAPCVLSTLFQRSLAIVMSAIHVVSSPG
jgi:hypothetical protein